MSFTITEASLLGALKSDGQICWSIRLVDRAGKVDQRDNLDLATAVHEVDSHLKQCLQSLRLGDLKRMILHGLMTAARDGASDDGWQSLEQVARLHPECQGSLYLNGGLLSQVVGALRNLAEQGIIAVEGEAPHGMRCRWIG